MNGCPCSASQLISSNGIYDNSILPCSSNPDSIQSWLDIANMPPKCPMHLIAYANIGGTSVSVVNSSTYVVGIWVASPFSLGANPQCIALGSDSLQNVEDANQWNFEHLTGKAGDLTIAPPLQKLMFLRGGTQWKNRIGLNLGGATYNDLQLSFRDNAATRGDAQGTIPVISFAGGGLTGSIVLEVVVKTFGHFSMGLRAKDVPGNYSMFEMEWLIVP